MERPVRKKRGLSSYFCEHSCMRPVVKPFFVVRRTRLCTVIQYSCAVQRSASVHCCSLCIRRTNILSICSSKYRLHYTGALRSRRSAIVYSGSSSNARLPLALSTPVAKRFLSVMMPCGQHSTMPQPATSRETRAQIPEFAWPRSSPSSTGLSQRPALCTTSSTSRLFATAIYTMS